MQNSRDPFQLTRFFDKFRNTLSYQKRDKSPLFSEREKGLGDELGILIACSGGIDSLALLYAMAELKDELNIRIGACYVDHKARTESVDEAKFVDKICQELQVTFFSGAFDDNFWSDTKNNFEERARNERYRILENIAIDNNFSYIATAHHLDDQVETILMRILERGTGLKGLCGIKPVVTHPLPLSSQKRGENAPLLSLGEKGLGDELKTVTIIRPLLDVSKSEIAEYMADRQYLSDHTNNDTAYRRNHYRKVVIPSLKGALPDVDIAGHLSVLAQNAQREREVMEELMREFWCSVGVDPCINPKKGENMVSPLHITRTLIKAHSDNFWMTAFSYLFAEYHGFSHSTQTLKDIVAFIRKTDPGTASYNPYIFQRNRDGVRIC